jgi:ABC-2 type transport system ATP-binding protein
VGWKQRLALGCSVLHRPPILFLDEPTSGVDPVSRRQFWDLIREMVGEGITVFVTTHYMDEAEYCDRLVLLDQGHIAAMGTPSALKTGRMKGQLLLIECDPLARALDLLQTAPGVQDAAVFGSSIHAVVADARIATQAVQDSLTRQGIHISRVEPIPASLEDVFVSLTAMREPKIREAA